MQAPSHQAFPVVRKDSGRMVLVGTILRPILHQVLSDKQCRFTTTDGPPTYRLGYEEIQGLEIHQKL